MASKKTDLTFAIGGSNILVAGDAGNASPDALELVYSGGETSVDKVTVKLVEIDEDETIDQSKPGKDAVVAEFAGKIADGAFVADSGKAATDKLPDDSPFIKVTVGGKTLDKVKLPGADHENGLFELAVVVSAGKSKYRSTWRAYVRHYTIRPADGPIIAFVTGAEDKTFFTAAGKYWKQHADAVLSKDGMSLEEIVAFLVKHRDAYGDYGEINIVAHGNRLSAILRVVTGGEREMRLKTIYRALGIEGEESSDPATAAIQAENAKKFAHSAEELGLSDKSRVVFRACNIGHRPDVLKAVRQHIFADACKVLAPKFLQTYSDGDVITNAKTDPFEYFTEDLQFRVPGKDSPPRKPKKEPDGTSQEEKMEPVFAAAHPSLTFADEKDSYTSKITVTKPGDMTYTLGGTEATFYDFVKNAHKTDAQIAAQMEAGFDAELSEDTEYTRWAQWAQTSITRKDRTQKVDKKVETVTTENLWVTVAGKTVVPNESFVSPGGDLVLGSDPTLGTSTDPDARPLGITLPDKAVADPHATITTSGAPAVAVQAEDGQTVTFDGKKVASFSGEVPLSFLVGPFQVKMRRERERLAVAELSRVLVHWRRPMREDDASVAYGKERALVVPDVDNTEHYGSSEDAIPSDEDLAKLFE